MLRSRVVLRKQGYCRHLMSRKRWWWGEGGGRGSVALATTVQPCTGNLISLAAIPCLQTEGSGPKGRFSQPGNMCLHAEHISITRESVLHLPHPWSNSPPGAQVLSARSGPSPDHPSYNVLKTDGPATLQTFSDSAHPPLILKIYFINI